ncbi:MAG: hypothetical protein IPP91_02890 [Betaproteobacteria bacterium]|nr:hypothetical protein [Betaproteobacteria bacterium]
MSSRSNPSRQVLRLAGVILGAMLSLQALSQAGTEMRVTVTLNDHTFLDSPIAGGIALTCKGTPTCVADTTYLDFTPYFAGLCSNALVGTFNGSMTGLNLAQSGAIQGQMNLLGSTPTPNADGTCSLTPTDITYFYTGTWDLGSRTGTLSINRTECVSQGISLCTGANTPPFTGSLKADAIPPPVFPMTVRSEINAVSATASADIEFRPQDVGTNGSVFVFALAPATLVKGGEDPKAMRFGFAKDARKVDTPIACVLAQLSQSGQMTAVTSSQLQAYVTGVLSAQGASVAILTGVPTSSVAGATFFVGYGSSGSSMINTGINRGAVTVPAAVQCQPGPPQTGWWWNPQEDGRGFSLEVRGNNIFFAGFLYDVSGRSTWYVSTGAVSLDGSYYTGDLLSASGGQTLGGAYPGFPALRSVGPITLTFHSASQGTLVWPGGTVPIQRFNIVPNGLNLPPAAGQPESGWWWNEEESGRGFFLEWQGGTLDIAGYMYDDPGNSVWYLTVGAIGGTPTARSFQGNWWSYGNGQTLTGAWKPNTRLSTNVAPVTIQFSSTETAVMTLPNGRTTNLKRHRF